MTSGIQPGAVLALNLVLLSGCALLGPDHQTQTAELSASFANAGQAGLSSDPVHTRWWQGFKDQELERLVDLAVAGNRIRQTDARAEASLAQYELTVLRALEETENALVELGRQQVRRDLLSSSAQASEEAARLARQRFEEGATDFLTVLDAERILLEAQDRLARSKTDTATALVALYKALGGGWEAVDKVVQTEPGSS